MQTLSNAIKHATEAHEGQLRKDGMPYIVHPMAVASHVRRVLNGSVSDVKLEMLMSCAMLHDVVEDCKVALDNIELDFGKQIMSIVEELTSDKKEIEKIGKDRGSMALGKTEYLKTKMVKMSDDALLIKLCDRLDNVSDIRFQPANKKEAYVQSTIDILDYLNSERNLTTIQSKLCLEIYTMCKIES